MNALPKLAALAALVLVLAGCSTDKKHGDCPAVSGLADASSMTAFKPGTVTDPTYALYTVEIASVDNDCDWDKRERSADTNITVHFRATRPPNGTAATYSVPYFVSVISGSDILVKRAYTVQFSFDPGQATADFSDTVDSTVINVEHGKQPYDYAILVGLQLSKAQLDYNHAMGRY